MVAPNKNLFTSNFNNMVKYIKNIFAFSLIFLVSFLLIVLSNYVLVKIKGIYIPKNKHILILGDSNMQMAINDTIIKSGINLSESADSYFYSYLKLREVVSKNSNIDTVLISFAPHNIFDNGWLLDDKNIYSRFKMYYPFMQWEDFYFILSKNPHALLTAIPAIPVSAFKNFYTELRGRNFYYGSFVQLKRNILKEVQLKLKNGEPLPFFKIPTKFSPSSEEQIYLDKIISLCEKNKIKLYLINTPKREELLNYAKYGVDQFDKLYDSKYANVDYLDLSKIKLNDEDYGDFVHLNSSGSTQFSQFIAKEGFAKLSTDYLRKKK